MNSIKNIQATITNHVQLAGYREIVEAFGKERGLKGFVFNDVDGSVKVMAGGLESAISGFIQDLKVKRPDTKIETIEIQEDIALPSPFGRVVSDDMREMSERFDTGIGILGEMNIKLGKLDKLDTMDVKLNNLDKLDTMDVKLSNLDKLDTMDVKLDNLDTMSAKLDITNNSINMLGDKIDTLPERIAEAMKK